PADGPSACAAHRRIAGQDVVEKCQIAGAVNAASQGIAAIRSTGDCAGAVAARLSEGLVAGEGVVLKRQVTLVENAAALIAAVVGAVADRQPLRDGQAAEGDVGPGDDGEYPAVVAAADRDRRAPRPGDDQVRIGDVQFTLPENNGAPEAAEGDLIRCAVG